MMQNKLLLKNKLKNLLPLGCLLLSACSKHYETLRNIDEQGKHVESMAEKSSNADRTVNLKPVQIEKGVYLGAQVVRSIHGQALPVELEASPGITITSGTSKSLQESIKLIGQLTKLSVSYKSGNNTQSSQDSTQDHPAASAVSEALSGAKSIDDALVKFSNSADMDINYSGSLSGLLNKIADHFDVDWNYQNGVLLFSENQVRKFDISALLGTTNVANSTSMGSSGEGGGGDSSGGESSSSGSSGSGSGSQSFNSSINVDLLKNIEKNISALLDDSQGKSIFNKDDSTVTVIARPSAVQRVANYIAGLNRSYERQVTLVMTVYSFTAKEDVSRTFDVQALVKKFTIGTGGYVDGNSLIGYTSPGKLSAALGFLSSQGKVATLTKATATTLSGRAVPLSITNSRGYVSSITRTEGTANNAPSSSVKTNSLSVGFSMIALPKVLDDGKVLIKLSTSISTLNGAKNGFDTFGDDKQQVQLPNVNNRSFIQENLLKNEQTLILGSFKDNSMTGDDKGTLSAMFKLFGGSQSDSNNNSIVLITLTPYVLNPDN